MSEIYRETAPQKDMMGIPSIHLGQELLILWYDTFTSGVFSQYLKSTSGLVLTMKLPPDDKKKVQKEPHSNF